MSIIGAGAIGGAIGGRLALAGRDVVLVARGEHLAALQSTGLRLRTPDEDVTAAGHGGGRARTSSTCTRRRAGAGHQDPAGEDGAGDLGRCARHGGRAAARPATGCRSYLALNGVAAEALALRYFRRVFGVCVWMPAVHLEPGEVIIRSTPQSGMLHLGRVPATADDGGCRRC